METPRRPRSSPALLMALAVVAVLVGGASVLAAWSWVTTPPTATAPVGASAPHAEEDGWAAWDHNDDGRPVRWDPCSPIDLVVDARGAYPGFERDLREAVDEVAALSGHRIAISDGVTERPAVDRAPYQPERYGETWAPVLVAFADPHEGDLPLLETDRAVAIPVAVGPPGDRVYVTGQIVLNEQREDLEAGTRDRATSWGATLRHELGHLVGLDHVDDEDQLMHLAPDEGPVAFGDGDRRGLRALGAGDCLARPDPQHVEVELDGDVAR